jgi:hypothetical protein
MRYINSMSEIPLALSCDNGVAYPEDLYGDSRNSIHGVAGMAGIRRSTIYERKQHGEKFQGV